jgi:CheY-like chemotaxis protein
MKVLLVDDEPAILELLTFAFEKKAATVSTAGDGESGLELTKQIAFDAAVVDKNLPGMSGLDLLAKIRENDRQIALLMMTGYASPETATQALNLDVDAYLEKPFPNLMMVVDRVAGAIQKRRTYLDSAGAPRPETPLVDAPAPGARVLLVTSPELEEGIRALLLPQDTTIVARKETELNQAVAQIADLVVIDAFLLGGEVVPVVERAQRTSKEAEFVVVYDRALDLRTVQRLIDLGVRRLVQSTGWGRPMRSALEQIRRKKR